MLPRWPLLLVSLAACRGCQDKPPTDALIQGANFAADKLGSPDADAHAEGSMALQDGGPAGDAATAARPRNTAAADGGTQTWLLRLAADGGMGLTALAEAVEPDVELDGGTPASAVVVDDGQRRTLIVGRAAGRPGEQLVGTVELPGGGTRIRLRLSRPLPHLAPVVEYETRRRQGRIVDGAKLWARVSQRGVEIIARRETSRLEAAQARSGEDDIPPDEALRQSQEEERRVTTARSDALAHEKRSADLEALTAWREVLDADGSDAQARAHLGQGLARLGRFEEARRELELALELGDRTGPALTTLCRVYRLLRSPHASTCPGRRR